MSPIKTTAMFLLFAMFASQAFAGDDPVADVLDGCEAEIEVYCNKVTPGEGRILYCVMAEEGSLSESCAQAMQETEG